MSEIRRVVNDLREAEFKAGFLHNDADLAERKNKIAEDVAKQLNAQQDAVEEALLKRGPI